MRTLVCVLGCFVALAASAGPSTTDSDGRRVTLKAPAGRVVSLAPHATELLFAIGAGNRVVGVSEYSDYPADALRLPRVSSSGGVDLEEVLALHPDLAVAWRFEATRGAIDRMEKLGIPVFLSEPRHLGDIAQNMDALGTLVGAEAGARAASEKFRAMLDGLQRGYAGRAPLKVFYHISMRPLISLNGRTMVSSAIELCGGVNVLADAPAFAPIVDAEAVFAADPDVVVVAQRNPQDSAWQANWRERFPALRAVREGNLVSVDATIMHRQGPRVLAAVESLCRQLDEVRQRPPRRTDATRSPPPKADIRR